jgi:2-haloacid dehalogenase
MSEGRPAVVVFDVNETLSDLSPLSRRFEEVGAPGHLAPTWFAGVLRDGFALTVSGESGAFGDLATEGLRAVLHGHPLDRDADDAVRHVMDGFTALTVHADVADGVRALRGLGLRLVTLSNGSAAVAEALLGRAGLRGEFEALLSVDDAGAWKPASRAYAYALGRCDVDPADAMLVAVHPWDVDGASRAGLRTAWVDRSGGPYPACFRPPELTVTSLTDLAERLRSS